MRRPSILPVLTILMLLLAGCGGSSSDAPSGGDPAAEGAEQTENASADTAATTMPSVSTCSGMAAEAALAASTAAEQGQQFLAANAECEGVNVTESGLQYEVLVPGDGARPEATSRVLVHYEGTFLNGQLFDSSYRRGDPTSFPLNRVIPGWTEGVALMPVGSTFRLFVPAALAYGPSGRGEIGPDETLIFQVELLEILE